jgi:hypothetical protein
VAEGRARNIYREEKRRKGKVRKEKIMDTQEREREGRRGGYRREGSDLVLSR